MPKKRYRRFRRASQEQKNLFNTKFTLFSRCCSHLSNQTGELAFSRDRNTIDLIINHLQWIKRKIMIEVYTDVTEEALQLYIEIIDHSLNYCFQINCRDEYFDGFLKHSPSDLTKERLHRLQIALELLTALEISMAISTLGLSALPMIMVSMVPVLFSESMMLITPILIVVPPAIYAVCALGVLLLGLKLVELAMKNFASPDHGTAKNTKHDVAEKLLECQKESSKMESLQFFNAVNPLKEQHQSFLETSNISRR